MPSDHENTVDRELLARLEAEGVVARATIASMKAAHTSCRRIGAGMGIIMATQKVTEEQAFDLLRAASQRSHRKLREVADEVVLTGILLEIPPGQA